MQTQKTLLDQVVTFFLSAFRLPGLAAKFVLIAIGLGLAFGAVWLTAYWPPLKKRQLWVIGAVSAFLTWTAIAFIQIPLQSASGLALTHFFSTAALTQWIYLVSIPAILLSGLVQEGAKLVPTVFWWLRHDRHLDPKIGLLAGAMAGAGFGVFEAVWVHNTMFAAGWTWQVVQANGFIGLSGFWERFFTVGFHISVAALAGYGLAKGWGWQFYLIASFLHGALNYVVVLYQTGLMKAVGLEIYVAVFSVVLTAVVVWIRWRTKPSGTEISAVESEPDSEGISPRSE
jgi:RsiW-degrading membrane proteinase PrsW (M82 family)